MLKVMIADDERIIRYGIISMVHWEKLGLELVGEASEGEEGYKLFLEKRPDIVITDLKMPGLDGIELVRKIKETDGNVKFVILSGYEDFSYAKEAIHLGVSEYLLKSDLMPEDIERILKKIIREIEESGTVGKKKETETQTDVPRLMEELCQGACVLPKAFPEELAEACRKGYCCLCIGAMEAEKKNAGLSRNMIKEQIKKLVPKFQIYLFQCGNYLGAVVFYEIEEETQLNAALEHCIMEMERWGMILTIGKSSHEKRLELAHEMFEKALISYDQRAFYGYGKVIKVSRKAAAGQSQQFFYPVSDLEKLVDYDRKEEMLQFLESNFEILKRRKNREELKFVSIELLLILNKIAAKVKDVEAAFQWKKDVYDQYFKLELADDMKLWFMERFTELLQCQRELDEKSVDVVEYIEKYVKENYDKKLSLQELSEAVNLNKNYVSQLFKKKTGKNIGSYITGVKIERAKELMKNTKLKVNVIAEKVGYEDERYFYKVFKSYTGITTTEYMKRIRP